jgi:radical SAM superfamily enzyme YgiQ (UPF0313 family)|tara:strand:+ start:2607 stop:4340 length:1734 start_codon:yes stop_codon:yes gene_type:complete
MKILFINTELYNDFWGGYNRDKQLKDVFMNKEFGVCPPMGLLYILSYLRKYYEKDLSLELIDLRLEMVKYYLNGGKDETTVDEFLHEIIETNIKRFKPDLIALSVLFDASAELAEDVCKITKGICGNAKIIMGGFYCSNRYGYLLKNDLCDFVCIGEGERPLLWLVQNELDPDMSITGIVSKEQFLKNTHTLEKDFLDELDEIPWPAYDIFDDRDMELYLVNQLASPNISGQRERTGVFMTSRGCPRRCTFCGTTTIHGHKFRKRTANDVISEIEHMVSRYKLDTIAILDDTFTLDKKRTVEILELIIKGDYGVGLQFPTGVDIRTLDEKVISLFKKAKVEDLHIAVESGNQHVNSFILKKGLNLEKVKKTVALLEENGINTSAFFMIGFPEETMEMINESKEFAKDLGVIWISVNTPTPVFGSELYRDCLERGLIKEDYYKDKLFTEAYFSTDNFTAQELPKIAYDFNIEVNFLYNKNIRTGKFDKILPRYLDISIRYPTHIVTWVCLYYCYKQMGDDQKRDEILRKIVELYKEPGDDSVNIEAWVTGNANLMFNKYRDDIYDLCPEFKNIPELSA